MTTMMLAISSSTTTTSSSSSSLFKIQPRKHSSTCITHKLITSFHTCKKEINGNNININITIINASETSKWVLRNNNNPTVVVTSSPSANNVVYTATDVVRMFYQGINGRDLASVEPLIAHNCVYEDLIFSQPFVGRKAIIEFFEKFIDSISTDLQFAIDDISEEDSSAVGVTWHLEWKGKPFPFSRGCSFYRLEVIDGQKQITYGRDSVEPAIKPGETALVAVRGVTWLLQQFPQLADRF